MNYIAVSLIFLTLYPAGIAQDANTPTKPPATANTTSTSTANSESPEAVAAKYVELWNTGDFDLIKSTFEFPATMTSRGSRMRLDAGMLRRVITAWRTSMPDLNWKVDDTIVQGDKVAMRLTFTGTYRNRLFPNTIDPQVHKTYQRPIRASAMWMIVVKDGKIRQVWEEYDEIKMHYEMGGFWRSNEELDAAIKASGKKDDPGSQSEPSTTPPKP